MSNKKNDETVTDAIPILVKNLLVEGSKSEIQAQDNWMKVLNSYSGHRLTVSDVRDS